MIIKNIHEKLLASIQQMLIDTVVNIPYYGEFNLHISFKEQETIGTCGVNVTSKGMNFYYSPKFLANLTQKEVNFITLHEDLHLLFNHPRRTITGQYDHKLANIAQDMIINHIIWEDINHLFIEIPKDSNGKNMALFVPLEYKGKLIFEELYEYLKEDREKWREKWREKNKANGESGSNVDDKKSYGPYGKNPSKTGDKTIDTWSKEKIYQDIEDGEGEYLDIHIQDEVPEDMKDSIVKDIMDRLAARGLVSSDIDKTLGKLRKKRKDYLREIKRSISNLIFGTYKQKTIVKPNRRQIQGLKGNRKVKSMINCILDTSGSMGGQNTFEKVLSYVYRSDISMNFIESDTKIKWVEKIKNKRKLESMKIKGLGGTVMQTGIDHVVENFNQYNTVLLTDGYTDSLDLSKLRGRLLIISVGVKVPISKSNGKVKQIFVDTDYK